MTDRDEWLPLVDGDGRTLGKARRSEVHGNPSLLHPVVHCLVVNASGALLLQLRSLSKDVQPGRWDTSVGGHVGLDESIEAALLREIHEELGVVVDRRQPSFLYSYVMTNALESELVHTYRLEHEGPFVAEPKEIDELRFWSLEAIEARLGSAVFTPNFEDEFARFRGVAETASRRR
jgi:isopentenyldiphosphate isomerase